jgi:transcriptional regulator with XRE-family HTH domain
MSFPTLLREYKRRTGSTEDEIAARCGVKRVTVNNWINGKNPPDLSNIPAIARMLGMDWKDIAAMILGEQGGEQPPIRPEEALVHSQAHPLTPGELTRLSGMIEAAFYGPERRHTDPMREIEPV